MTTQNSAAYPAVAHKKLYQHLYFQVLVAIIIGILLVHHVIDYAGNFRIDGCGPE